MLDPRTIANTRRLLVAAHASLVDAQLHGIEIPARIFDDLGVILDAVALDDGRIPEPRHRPSSRPGPENDAPTAAAALEKLAHLLGILVRNWYPAAESIGAHDDASTRIATVIDLKPEPPATAL